MPSGPSRGGGSGASAGEQGTEGGQTVTAGVRSGRGDLSGGAATEVSGWLGNDDDRLGHGVKAVGDGPDRGRDLSRHDWDSARAAMPNSVW
jgi:hypothetical protein